MATMPKVVATGITTRAPTVVGGIPDSEARNPAPQESPATTAVVITSLSNISATTTLNLEMSRARKNSAHGWFVSRIRREVSVSLKA